MRGKDFSIATVQLLNALPRKRLMNTVKLLYTEADHQPIKVSRLLLTGRDSPGIQAEVFCTTGYLLNEDAGD